MNNFITYYESDLASLPANQSLTKETVITLGPNATNTGKETITLSLTFSARGKYTDPRTGQLEYLVDWNNIACISK